MAILTALRYWRKGVPRLAGPWHDCLRGAHTGAPVLVHGNGPSAAAGLEWSRKRFGDALVTIGMNASGLLLAPHYYLILDHVAFANYGLLIDPARSRPVLQPSALARITRRRRAGQPELDAHARMLAAHPSTVRLRRRAHSFETPVFDALDPAVGATAGIAAMQLGLLMLGATSPGVDQARSGGTLIVTGLDGYASAVRHISSRAAAFTDADKREIINASQNAHLRQLFELAARAGLRAINLSARGTLAANDLCRDPEFDVAHP